MLKNNKKLLRDNQMKGYDNHMYDILDGMIDWVRVIDENGKIIYANKTMEDGLGRSIVGDTCYSVLGKACHCKGCITKTTIATGIIAEKEEKIGDKIFSVKSSPVKDINGNIYAAVEVFRDVTRERKLEKEILQKNKKMRKDLFFAKALQEKILPMKGTFENICVDYMYKPSELLSGDMFDVFPIDEDHIGLYMSDVAGHGVSASMMTMFIRQTLRGIKDYIVTPKEAISELHKRFLDLNLDDDRYFTIFYGVIDKKNHTFRYVNGGHNSIPILINKEKTELLETRGYPITYLFDSIEYEENQVNLQKGDKLVLYTDGIIEGKNHEGKVFGLERLISTVNESSDNKILAIEEAIQAFDYEAQEDDLAVLTIDYLS